MPCHTIVSYANDVYIHAICFQWEAQLPTEVQRKLQKERPQYFKRRDLLGELANAAIDSLDVNTLENHPLYT